MLIRQKTRMGFGRPGCCFHTVFKGVCDGEKSQRPARHFEKEAISLPPLPIPARLSKPKPAGCCFLGRAGRAEQGLPGSLGR